MQQSIIDIKLIEGFFLSLSFDFNSYCRICDNSKKSRIQPEKNACRLGNVTHLCGNLILLLEIVNFFTWHPAAEW